MGSISVRATLLLVTGLIASMAPALASAQTTRQGDFETTRGSAMGTGARASSASTAALAYNPANLALGSLYHLEGNVSYHPDADRWSAGAAVVDSMTSAVAAGLSLRGIFGDGDYDGFDGRLGLGLPIGEYFAVGLAGRYLSVSPPEVDEATAAAEPAPPVDDNTTAEGFSMDAAIRVTPTQGFHIAALAYNIIDYESAVAPLLLGGGLGFQLAEFSLGADLLTDLTTFDKSTYRVGGGIEWLLAGSAPLRAGYSHDTGRKTHTISGGVGYVDRTAGFDVTMRRQVAGGDETELFAAVRYFVQ